MFLLYCSRLYEERVGKGAHLGIITENKTDYAGSSPKRYVDFLLITMQIKCELINC